MFVTTHPYDFGGGAPELPEFRRNDSQYPIERFVGDIARLQATPGVRFVSVADLLAEPEKFTRSRLIANLQLRSYERHGNPFGSYVVRYGLVPAFLGLYAASGVYYSEEGARAIHQKLWIATGAIYGGTMALCALGLLLLCRRYPRHRDRASGWLLAAFVVAAVYGCIHLVFVGGYTRTVIAITLCAGAAIGLGIDRVTSAASRRMAGSATEIAQR